jgi:hypothetical protein
MNLVENGRNSLDLVEHDPPSMSRWEHALQPLRGCEQRHVDLGLEQVEVRRVPKPIPQPARLPGPRVPNRKKLLLPGA